MMRDGNTTAPTGDRGELEKGKEWGKSRGVWRREGIAG